MSASAHQQRTVDFGSKRVIITLKPTGAVDVTVVGGKFDELSAPEILGILEAMDTFDESQVAA